MIKINQTKNNGPVELKMKKVRRNLAGLIFAALGIIFLYQDMAPTMDHMNPSGHMNHEPTDHSVTLLGVGEMTWMWFTMAIVHFFLNDRGCKTCKGAE
jgi:hypothetical protein